MESPANYFNNSESRVWVQAGTFNHFTGSNQSDKLRADDERKKCLGSLLSNNYKAREDISVASSKTCDWLLKTREFKRWRDRFHPTNDNGVFWLKGKPGSGKSTMMRHISDHLQESDDAVLVEHFFNARGIGLAKTFLGLLRSLSYQLVRKDPEFYNAFIPIYHEKNMIQEQWEWRQNELKDFLQSQLKRTKLKLIVLVDALDECTLGEISSVVSFLEDLSLDAVDSDTNLRICLSSRPYPNISMKNDQEFTLDGNAEHDEDIKKYVRAKLKSDNLEIEKKVLRKAHGVFLWVVLVVAMLNKAVEHGRPEEMQKTLDNIPSDLDKFFESIIFDDTEKNPETLLMFQLVLFSKRELKPAELVFAMISKFQEGCLKPRSQSKMTDDLLKARIIHSSKGLIEISGRTGTIQFIHQTVTDFFLRSRRLERLCSTLEPDAISSSHDQLRACCQDYIEKFPTNSQSHCGLPVVRLNYEYPFLDYSAVYLLHHAEAALQGHRLGIGNDGWPLSSDPWFQAWKRIMFTLDKTMYLHGDINVGLIYILLLHDFHNSLTVILKYGDVDVNIQGGSFNNALQLALLKRDDVTTRMLLERGASVHLSGGYFGTILQLASAQGNHSLVYTILKKGADVNALGGIYETALQAAAARGHPQILKTLLRKGAEVNVLGGIYGSALHAAMAMGKARIFQSLLQAGADMNSCGSSYGPLLYLDDIVGLLNPDGTFVQSPSPSFAGTTFSLENGPAIIWAARNLGYDQVKLLLENGADVNAASGPWKSDVPFNFHILECHGVSVNHELGVTALIWAARHRKMDMIDILLKNGADIEAHYSSGETALLAGSEAGHEIVVRYLISRGADPYAKNNLGQSALYKAAAGGHVNIMRLLLHYLGDFRDDHNWGGFHAIKYAEIDTMLVNGGVSSLFLDYQQNIRYKDYKHSIRCLIMNGGILYKGPEMHRPFVYIERIQINGGLCFFDTTNTKNFHIKKLEINGGSVHLVGHENELRIDNVELNDGHLSISTERVTFNKVLILGGSFNCNSSSFLRANQVKMGNTHSNLSGRQNLVDPLSINGLPEIYMEHSDGQIEQYGATQSADQNIQISAILSPLYVAAQNGHLEAVQLLLQSGAKYDKVWPTMNPLEIAELNGHDEIVRLLQEKGQEAEINGNKKQRTLRTDEKRKRKK